MKTIKNFNLIFGLSFGSPAKEHMTYDSENGNLMYKDEGTDKNYIGIVKSPWKWDSFCFAADKLE